MEGYMLRYQKNITLFFLILSIISTTTVSAGSETDLGKGIALFETEKYDDARQLFSAMATKEPNNPEACYYLGRIFLNDGDAEKAITWLGKAIDINAGVSKYHQWLGLAYGNKIHSTANFKKPLIALKIKNEYEKAIELDEDNNQARFGLVTYYLDAPGFMGGSIKKAGKFADELQKRDPVMGHEAYIKIYEAEKKYDLAEKEYIALLEKDPANFEYRNKFAWFYISRKDYETAYNELVEMVRDYPERDWPYYSIGYIGFVSNTHLDDAEKSMLKLFDVIATSNTIRHPNDRLAWYHYMLGSIYKKNMKKDLARNEFEFALNLNPFLKEAKEAFDGL